MGTKRTDGVERTQLSAHVDRRLVKEMDRQGLNKSDVVEEALKLYLEQSMSDKHLAHKLKSERDEVLEKIEQKKQRLEAIEAKAQDKLGTTLDDFVEDHDVASPWADKKREFIDQYLEDYLERKNFEINPYYVADKVYDLALKREFSLEGEAAVDFVKECAQEVSDKTNFTAEKNVNQTRQGIIL